MTRQRIVEGLRVPHELLGAHAGDVIRPVRHDGVEGDDGPGGRRRVDGLDVLEPVARRPVVALILAVNEGLLDVLGIDGPPAPPHRARVELECDDGLAVLLLGLEGGVEVRVGGAGAVSVPVDEVGRYPVDNAAQVARVADRGGEIPVVDRPLNSDLEIAAVFEGGGVLDVHRPVGRGVVLAAGLLVLGARGQCGERCGRRGAGQEQTTVHHRGWSPIRRIMGVRNTRRGESKNL